ncbi:ubiquinol oxidase subunit II [Acinetobacter qingfengensis]|uniref:Ubiquinol oxidase subunit 2 n=1 Tax=Acinetobacter qingfengensis TaxID=1262585 RepID=A0A1E7RDF0_9GAMM|nr:ubiquinol oxidase subunit II [Acinetobacter qingfengensis]KAA8735312.1 ubiquinol oxidase subunit II [Acinetobacter qingfengensis]OEY97430.1 ubiquinol oxidase subunit II [Acinetobacter qingfengensis]
MRQKTLAVLSLLTATTLLTGCGGDIVLLNSEGPVAQGLSGLMVTAIYVMLLVVIPSIIMALWFGWKYRKSNKDADYQPNWAHSTAIEIVVWGIPIIIIAFLAYLAYKGSHDYDPYKSRAADSSEELTIQVIAEQFKWIFIYPEQNIATINEVRFPEQQPIAFRITSNFTMNSFFIPKLAGQIYAMAGMQTQLHLSADTTGVYRGFSANYSGYGFSQMYFKAHSVTKAQFDEWVNTIKAGKGNTIVVDDKGTTAIQKGLLDQAEFATLKDGDRSKHQIEALVKEAQRKGDTEALEKAEAMKPFPNKPTPVTYYSSVQPDLFKTVINAYMSNYHGNTHAGSHEQVAHEAAASVEVPASQDTATAKTVAGE